VSPRALDSSSHSRTGRGLLLSTRHNCPTPGSVEAACRLRKLYHPRPRSRKRFEQPLGALNHTSPISRSREAAPDLYPQPRDLGRYARAWPGGFVLGVDSLIELGLPLKVRGDRAGCWPSLVGTDVSSRSSPSTGAPGVVTPCSTTGGWPPPGIVRSHIDPDRRDRCSFPPAVLKADQATIHHQQAHHQGEHGAFSRTVRHDMGLLQALGFDPCFQGLFLRRRKGGWIACR